jgi:hypothetical protein
MLREGGGEGGREGGRGLSKLVQAPGLLEGGEEGGEQGRERSRIASKSELISPPWHIHPFTKTRFRISLRFSRIPICSISTSGTALQGYKKSWRGSYLCVVKCVAWEKTPKRKPMVV